MQRSHLPGLVALGFVLTACSGSTVASTGPDAAPSESSEGGASGDATTEEGLDGGGPPASDATSLADAVEASSGGRDAATDAGATGVQCGAQGPPAFPTFDKTCATAADCALAVHMLSCCGNVLVMAINRAALPAFQTAEGTCESQFPGCGCASNSVQIEDGVAYGDTSNPTSAAAASCVGGSCLATFTGPTFACGGEVCATGVDYCQVVASADGGPATDRCVFVGFPVGDAGVACSGIALAQGCTCAQNQGNVTVTCH